MRKIRGNDIAMIFQEPMTSLNPVFTIGDQISEAVMLHQDVAKSRGQGHRAIEMLADGRHPDAGAPRQAVPARAVGRHAPARDDRDGARRAIRSCSSPTSPRPPSTSRSRRQILELIKEIQERTGTALLLITHDLGVVAETVDDVVVMYAGRVVETGHGRGGAAARPQHPYTEGLLDSIPSKGMRGQRLKSIKGTVPEPVQDAQGLQVRAALPVRFGTSCVRSRSRAAGRLRLRSGARSRCWLRDPGRCGARLASCDAGVQRYCRRGPTMPSPTAWTDARSHADAPAPRGRPPRRLRSRRRRSSRSRT